MLKGNIDNRDSVFIKEVIVGRCSFFGIRNSVFIIEVNFFRSFKRCNIAANMSFIRSCPTKGGIINPDPVSFGIENSYNFVSVGFLRYFNCEFSVFFSFRFRFGSDFLFALRVLDNRFFLNTAGTKHQQS